MMLNTLKFNTVKPILQNCLETIMSIEAFHAFRLVGGTSLSLRFGHRMSDDIDLFTDAAYGTIDFYHLQNILRRTFPYCYGDCGKIVGLGTSYMIGQNKDNCVKLDMYYTDAYIKPIETHHDIRMASVEDIIAMKMDVITRGGRKKDFWDLHYLHAHYSVKKMIELYTVRYPYGASMQECLSALQNFSVADNDPDPICLLNKIWPFIKLDFSEWTSSLSF